MTNGHVGVFCENCEAAVEKKVRKNDQENDQQRPLQTEKKDPSSDLTKVQANEEEVRAEGIYKILENTFNEYLFGKTTI